VRGLDRRRSPTRQRTVRHRPRLRSHALATGAARPVGVRYVSLARLSHCLSLEASKRNCTSRRLPATRQWASGRPTPPTYVRVSPGGMARWRPAWSASPIAGWELSPPLEPSALPATDIELLPDVSARRRSPGWMMNPHPRSCFVFARAPTDHTVRFLPV
jgi:hypothetical protein